MRSTKTLALGLLLIGPAVARAATPDDDLTVVKRAVLEREQGQPAPEASAGPATRPEARKEPGRKRAKEPQWLRVRIESKDGKRGRVSVNVPLALVRALGDDSAIGAEWRDREGHKLRLSDVLDALDNGQSLVEIEDQEASIRVWVD